MVKDLVPPVNVLVTQLRDRNQLGKGVLTARSCTRSHVLVKQICMIDKLFPLPDHGSYVVAVTVARSQVLF